MITIKDIAKLAGVSPSTVSRVISNHPRISIETSAKVRQIMKEYNYHPNIMAKSLVSKTSHTLGIMLPRPAEELFQNYFFGELLRGIMALATRMNYELLLSTETSLGNGIDALSRLVYGRRVDGILLLSSRREDPSITFLEEEGFPFVLIGRSETHPHAPMVDNDNVQTAYDATSHLIAQGHTRIGFVSGPPEFTLSHDRMVGYTKAMEDAQLKVHEDWILEGEHLLESGFQAMSLFMSLPERLTAIVIIDDHVAFGVLRALAELGFRVPEDISVVSFNNIALSELALPPLSSIDIGTYQLGYSAVQLLLKILQGETPPPHPIIIPHQLMVRESSLFVLPKHI